MYEGCSVILSMERNILKDGIFDEDEHEASVVKYKERDEYIYLSVEDYDLPELSLDAIYECKIQGEEEVRCLGTIVERYQSSGRSTIKFKIQNGLYKKLLN